MKTRFVFCYALVCLVVTAVAYSQDAAKVDAKHYKVETENAEVRVIRVHYGPHEKSVMHSHPDSVAVFLTDGNVRMTDASGKKQDMAVKAGQTMYTPAQVHLPENTNDTGFDLILVELKGPAATAAKASVAK